MGSKIRVSFIIGILFVSFLSAVSLTSVVIADEAHRSQYGFSAKILDRKDKALITYGYAKYLRDALPKASFIGFTGTPIEKSDKSTPAVFGNYVDVYDIEQAVDDGATVRIFYESRLAKLELKPEERFAFDNLKKRKDILLIDAQKIKSAYLTDLGEKIIKSGVKTDNMIDRLK